MKVDNISLNIQLNHDEMMALVSAIATYGLDLEHMMKSGLKPNDPRMTMAKDHQSAIKSIETKFENFMKENDFEFALVYASTAA